MKSPLLPSFFLVATGLFLLGVARVLALANEAGASQLLASELPSGVTLSTASNEQVVTATRKAVRREPRLAVSVVRIAIVAKTPARGRPRATTTTARTGGDFKDVIDRSKEGVCPPCDFVVGVARAAIEGNTGEASAIVEEASMLCPGCAGDLQALLSDPGLALGEAGDDYLSSPYGFGFGLGPGFPGGPVFGGGIVTGGGILALSPVGSPVSPVENN